MPFQRKVTPAALPIRATISRVARIDACAGAISVSWLTVWPSAWTEIQEVSWARITRVRGTAAFRDEVEVGFLKVRVLTSLAAVLSTELAVDVSDTARDAETAFLD